MSAPLAEHLDQRLVGQAEAGAGSPVLPGPRRSTLSAAE
jgi:hypothetical protein